MTPLTPQPAGRPWAAAPSIPYWPGNTRIFPSMGTRSVPPASAFAAPVSKGYGAQQMAGTDGSRRHRGFVAKELGR